MVAEAEKEDIRSRMEEGGEGGGMTRGYATQGGGEESGGGGKGAGEGEVFGEGGVGFEAGEEIRFGWSGW